MTALSRGMTISAVHHLHLSQSMRVTGRRTDRRTDRPTDSITIPKTALAYAHAVKHNDRKQSDRQRQFLLERDQ